MLRKNACYAKTRCLTRVFVGARLYVMMTKEMKMIRDTVYVSPFFGHVCRIPAAAVKTYIERDAALTKLRELGGIHAAPSPAMLKLRAKMLRCKRKIEREGWYSVIL